MDKSFRKMYNVYQNARHHIAKKSNSIDEKQVKQLLSNIFSPGPSYQFIFNLTTMKIDYVTETIREIFDKEPADFVPKDIFESIHPQDHSHYIYCENIAKYFLFSKIPPEDIPYYKITYQFRMRTRSGYRLFLHQALAIDTDEEGNIAKTFVNHSDIHHITKVNNKKVSIIGIDGKPSFLNIASQEDLDQYTSADILYSEKEIIILRMLSEGCSSHEIAELLNISHNTVRTHRKNILTKSPKKNMIQTVSSAIRNGLI